MPIAEPGEEAQVAKAEKRVQVFIDLPADVKRMLIAEAQTRNHSLNEVVVSILAAAYGYEYEPRELPFGGASLARATPVRMPKELRVRIGVRAVRRGISRNAEMLGVFREHFATAAAA